MSQGPVNFGGAGDIDMYPEETRALMRRLREAGGAFGDRWTVLSAAIKAGEAETDTGFDTLSVHFRAQYNPAKPQVEDLSTNVRPNLDRLGGTGEELVAQYVAGAERDAARMRALG